MRQLNPDTQCGRIVAYMRHYKTITEQDCIAWDRVHTKSENMGRRLAARIYDLRNDFGFLIGHRDFKTHTEYWIVSYPKEKQGELML